MTVDKDEMAFGFVDKRGDESASERQREYRFDFYDDDDDEQMK